jgi:hypothetical protein
MLIACTNKGCLKTSNALLDESSGEVICQECGKPINNISEAMKRTLKSFGLVIRNQERKAFLLACNQCKANRNIVLDQNGNTICKICHNIINVTPAFRLAMEESGIKLERIEIALEEEKTKKKIKRKKI